MTTATANPHHPLDLTFYSAPPDGADTMDLHIKVLVPASWEGLKINPILHVSTKTVIVKDWET